MIHFNILIRVLGESQYRFTSVLVMKAKEARITNHFDFIIREQTLSYYSFYIL